LDNHYDPTNLLSGCSGGQFRAAPALAWWSMCERLESACSGVICGGLCGNGDSVVDIEGGIAAGTLSDGLCFDSAFVFIFPFVYYYSHVNPFRMIKWFLFHVLYYSEKQ